MSTIIIVPVASEIAVIPAIALVFIFPPVAVVPVKSFIFIGPPFPSCVITVMAIIIIIIVDISPARYYNLSLNGQTGINIASAILGLRNGD
jgi:hypothetical protein